MTSISDFNLVQLVDENADSNEMNFKALDLYNEYAVGAVQYSSVLTSAVMAWGPNAEFPDEGTVLTIGSTGFIHFIVEGQDEAAQMRLSPDDKLQLTGKNGTHIKGGDSNNTVEISNTEFSYDAATGTNIIDAGDHQFYGEITKRNFQFDSKLSDFSGSVQVHGDMLTNGHIISRTLNVVKTSDSQNISTGFGFRVTNNDALELYKYDSFNNFTQRIAIFGDGGVIKDDSDESFPIFGTSSYDASNQITLGNAERSNYSIWETNGADVFYDSGTVLIGTNQSVDSSTNNFDLEVFGKVLFQSGLEFGSGQGGLEIDSNELKNVERITFNAVNQQTGSVISPDPIFKGTLSSLYLDDLPADYETRRQQNPNLWFLAEPKQIDLSGFNAGNRLLSGATNIADNSGHNRKQLTMANLFYGEDLHSEIISGTIDNTNVNDLLNLSITGVNPISGSLLHNKYGPGKIGMQTVWFDQIQNDVELRNFKYDSLDSLCNLTIENQLSVQSIHFPATEDTATYGESNADFDGTIDTILGTNSFNLTNFNDDITVKSVLSVASLSIGTIGDITPSDSNTTTIGTDVAPFHATYVSETHIGDATITTTNVNGDNIVTIDKPLQITDPAGIILADGSPLNGMGIEGDERTTFDYVSLSSYKNSYYRIKGEITQKKDRPDTPSTELTKLYVYESKNSSGLIVPNDQTGTYFNSYDNTSYTFELNNGLMLSSQNISTVDLNLTDESGVKRNKLYITTFKPGSVNDIIDLNMYIPNTDEFNHKFFVDFNYFHNDHMLSVNNREFSQYLPFGYISGESMVYNKTKYLNSNLHTEDTNKHLIQFISYYDVPVEDEDFTGHTYTYEDVSPYSLGYDTDSNENNYFYFAPKNTEDRIGGFYHYFTKSVALGSINDAFAGDFLLYPKITFKNWKNDRNETSFEIVPYDEWDIVDEATSTVVPANIPSSWKLKLLELTYSYLKYGKPGKLNPSDSTLIQGVDSSILDDPNSYAITTRLFNGMTINNGIRFDDSIFSYDGVNIQIV